MVDASVAVCGVRARGGWIGSVAQSGVTQRYVTCARRAASLAKRISIFAFINIDNVVLCN
jgi:polynucleotide 5'-kinase involved in rRNA processing